VVEPGGKASGAGDRRINEAEAAIVRRIFCEFADGRSPRAIAKSLNAAGIPGPGSRPWGDTTIRGQADRGTGVLNNSVYAARLEWNRCAYTKDPRTGKRVARPNRPRSGRLCRCRICALSTMIFGYGSRHDSGKCGSRLGVIMMATPSTARIGAVSR
jgi:Recombinase